MISIWLNINKNKLNNLIEREVIFMKKIIFYFIIPVIMLIFVYNANIVPSRYNKATYVALSNNYISNEYNC